MSAIRPGLQAFSSAFNRIAMKKLLYILAGLGLAACTSDIEELPEVGPQPGREVTLTGISGTASRTQFVPGDGTEIQFQWSTGDRIWAGGVQSAEAGTDGNVADFGFTNLPGAAPYRIYYNMTGTDAEAVVPTEQRQAEPGKLQLGPNGDFGYATTDSEGRFTLSHATAYVWFNPWSQDVKEKLVSVTLAATDASTVLTGTRTFDGTGFSDATDANNAVTLSFGKEGVELPATSSTASVFAAAVVYPADCSAEEIHVTYTFADGSVYTETKTGRNFEAGRIYRLTTEITKRDGGSLEIQGLEDSDEPVCMKYGASEAYALTAGGWIPTVEMTSAPAGWTADFDISLYAPAYSSGFEIFGAEGMKSTILKTYAPWQGAEGEETQLFIARNGEQAPADFPGQVLDGDARRIVCMSSTYIAMLDALGEPQRVVGVSGIDYISNPYVASHKEQIGDVGYDGNMNYERLLSLSPDIVLLFGVSGASAMEPKLRELGIPYAYMGEYLEQSPLGKAEWLVAVAEIAGMRERGEEVFREIPLRYDSLKTLAAKAERKPVVMLNTPYGDSWLMAPPSSYVARLIADAGGQYVYTQDTGNQSRPIDTEEAYRLAEMSDCWINVGSAASLKELAEIVPKFMDTRPVREGRVYNNNRRTNPSGGNDYWESGVIHPDLILQDLIRIFHPELTDAEPTYYRKLN